MADWSYKAWTASAGALALATCVAGGVVGCKKKDDSNAKAEKSTAEAKKRPQGDRYADGTRLAAAQKEWVKRWSDTTDLPACEPLLKDKAELELCKTAQTALTNLKTAVAKPEAEADATLIHDAAELAFATESASEKLGDKIKSTETAPLDPDQQLMQGYARTNRAALRYLSQFLQFGSLPTRRATFTWMR